MRKDFPKIYERNINVKVIDEGKGKFTVRRASLFDYRSTASTPSSWWTSQARLSKRRRRCCRADRIRPIARARWRMPASCKARSSVRESAARPSSCWGGPRDAFTWSKFFRQRFGFTATLLIGRHSGLEQEYVASEEEHRQKWMPILRNSCQVFREEPLQQSKKS